MKTKMKLNYLKENKVLKYILGVILGLVILSLIISIWLGIQESFRIVFGSVYILFLPGLVLTFAFFREKEIDIIERIALSFALSIAVVPLLVFYLNLIGMKIDVINIVLVVAIIVFGGIGVIFWKKEKTEKNLTEADNLIK
ncbi:MAG: DUF1616 domain-containing protein [Candidatus Pacebacteria bacterium]|nr:DUF1616 domain-containing protein [Candidatus Paceibacterota bacterium]